MTTIVRSARLVATALACMAFAAPVHAAGANRTFVSAFGNDANPCTISQPCRTLQAAFNATANDGEIEVLDPTGYGALIITHGISIQGHGWASMNGPATADVISINAGASDTVELRGLILQGFGTGSSQNGIRLNSGKSLSVEDCIVRNFSSDGILLFPSPIAPDVSVSVSNTLVSNNRRFNFELLVTSGNKLEVSLSRVEAARGPSHGLFQSAENANSVVNLTVTDSIFLSNVADGILTRSINGTANLLVLRSAFAYNGAGIEATGAGASARIGQSAITNNVQSWTVTSAATLNSYGDNEINGNSDGDPAPTITSKK